MRRKRKIIIACVVVCLALVVIWSSTRPQLEVHGNFSKQDVTELVRLAHVAQGEEIIGWQVPPPPWTFGGISYRWRKFRLHSAPVLKIEKIGDVFAYYATTSDGAGKRIVEYDSLRKISLNTARNGVHNAV